ncbi:TetR/AcrR family transcriptional regulator [Rhizobium sp. KAs_5_22]|jgi:TetR/AcrR family transcriptional repressor of nem operon|uniref:TetR/AcrR family transcriptional regulator n=1 Tax=Ciceribacter selenitireducens TaxID=448181 RepID=UPI00048B15F8|nr:TetR/AcrR family transcriptional regulator [Ciceribacter selenitireducens]PPJ49132.1 TetR/AcrR family transcriptional regulator [Rhizobium sp. KAs_5_22]
MRVSRAQAEANRETVINVASRLFREHGFDGIGLKDLMKGAGLTQGGFYKQFESKDDLAALASRRAMESATRRWSSVAASSADPIQGVIELYLSAGHRGETGDGCPLVALGSDAARQSEDVRKPFEDGIKAHLQVLEELLPASDSSETRAEKAEVMLALMVGAVTLSRIVTDKALADRLLEAAAAEAKRISTSALAE